MIGETIGNFKIVSRLGRGGMGEVWLAEQQSIGTRVAIKVLNSTISEDTEHVQRFFNEARAVSRIQHAGIVRIFDVGHHAGHAYLIMEFLEGETLAQRIAHTKRLSLTDLCEIARQAASVLDATHSAGITHRDLKPDNIYIVPDRELSRGYRVKILDFGIAKLTGTLAGISPRTTGTMGTPAYMAPEQWGDASKVDWRADLYSLGCVTFEMACGRPPFIVSNIAEACAKHLHDPPPHVREFVPDLPASLDTLVDRLLAKAPAARAESMRDVERAFASLGAGQPFALAATLPSMPPAAATPTKPATHEGRVSATVMPTNPEPRRRTGLPLLAKIALVAVGLIVSLAVVKRMTGRRVIGANQPADREPAPTPAPIAADAAVAVVSDDAAQVAAAPVDAKPADRPKRNPKVGDQRDDKGRDPKVGTAQHDDQQGRPADVIVEARDQIETPAKEGTIDADGVFKATLNDKSIQYCYLSEVRKNPSLGGKLTAAVLIDESGRASKVNATGVSSSVERCVERRLRVIQFPKPVGGPVLAYIPFTFEPPPPEDVAKGGNFEVHAGGADEMRVTPTSEEIRVEMARVSGLLGHCKGGDRGRITIRIKPDGRLSDAQVLGANAGTEFASCVEKSVVQHARFPKSRSGVTSSIQFQITSQ